jgi:hypothetical protein
MAHDWYGGLEPELDWSMIPGKPDDPEMRESTSIWLFEENGEFAIPRIGIEAVGEVWENHFMTGNFTFKGGRVLRLCKRAPTLPVKGADGRNSVLGAGPLRFECLEPFRRWRVSFEDDVYESTIEEQIKGNFRVFGQDDVDPSYKRTRIAFDVELEMVTPAWTQDYRKEKLGSMSEQERIDAGLMGYGWRIEHLFRGEGTLTIDGATRDFKSLGSRIHRQSVRPMGAFRGHCWQSAVFPDGRAFGYIAYPPREDGSTYNEGYVWQDGKWYPARANKIPFLRNIQPENDDVSVEMEYALGTVRIEGRTMLPTFHMGNPGTNGMNNNQGGVRYSWDGMETLGMIERSSPAELCTVVG